MSVDEVYLTGGINELAWQGKKSDQKGVGNNVQIKKKIKTKRFGGQHGTQKAPKMDPQIVFLATQMEQKFD